MNKREVLEIIKTAQFIIGAPIDDTMGLRWKVTDKPLWGIPPWRPGKGVEFFNVWKDVAVGVEKEDVYTILFIFRKRKGNYDHPHFFGNDKYGVRELVARHLKKNIKMQRKKKDGGVREIMEGAKTGEMGDILKSKSRDVVEERDVVNDFWAMKWEVIESSYIPWDCAECGMKVDDCICVDWDDSGWAGYMAEISDKGANDILNDIRAGGIKVEDIKLVYYENERKRVLATKEKGVKK